jgi:MFS transporter, SP family, general alpha glucoside:H+ symporter
MTRVGRRRLYLVGLSIMFSILLIVGVMGIPKASQAIGYTSGAFVMLFVLLFDLTIGQSAKEHFVPRIGRRGFARADQDAM